MHMHVAIDGCLVAHTTQPGSEIFVFHEYGQWTLLTVTTARSLDETAWMTLQCVASLDDLGPLLDQAWGPELSHDLHAFLAEAD